MNCKVRNTAGSDRTAHCSSEMERYNALVYWCRESISGNKDFLYDTCLFHDAVHAATLDFGYPYESIQSLLRNLHLNHVKNTAYRVKSQSKRHAERYTQGESIMSLAQCNRYPPYLFARAIVEEITNFRGRKGLTDAMRDPMGKLGHNSAVLEAYQESEQVESIPGHTGVDTLCNHYSNTMSPVTRLAAEVLDVIKRDPMYGPTHDAERSRVGIEYEIILEQCLQAMGIPFETEEQLRQRGASRTPDILLYIPVGVKVANSNGGSDWKVVCWIDSKALFGDEATHKDTIQSQAESYVHRFGPGLLLYWFGHAPMERLDDFQGDIVICGWKLPDELLLPSGEVVREGQIAPSLLRQKRVVVDLNSADRKSVV